MTVHLSHVVGDQALQPIRFRDEAAQFLLVGRHCLWFSPLDAPERVPVFGGEGLLDACKNSGDRLESDGYSPASAAMWAQAPRRSVRLFATNGSAAGSLLMLASVSLSRQN